MHYLPELLAGANMWRISGDFWDEWNKLHAQFDLLAQWEGVGGPRHFLAFTLFLADSDDRDQTFAVFHTESSRDLDRLRQFPQL